MGRVGVPAGSLVRNEAGAETVISTVLLLGIMITITGSMLAWAIPQLQANEALASYNATYYHLEAFQGELEALITQGEGASRSSGVSISAGTFTIHGDELDWFITWTTVDTAEIAIRDIEEDSPSFTVYDLEQDFSTPDKDWTVRVLWLETGHENTSGLVRGQATFDQNLSAPLRGWVLDDDEEVVAGFLWLGPDTLRWRYISPGGNYKLYITNGAILAKEPGVNFRVVNEPIMVTRMEGDRYKAMVWNLVTFNTTNSDYHSAGSSDFVIATNNLGTTSTTIQDIYALKVQFIGAGANAWRSYFTGELGFGTASDHPEVILNQDTPFRLDLVETDVGINLRTR